MTHCFFLLLVVMALLVEQKIWMENILKIFFKAPKMPVANGANLKLFTLIPAGTMPLYSFLIMIQNCCFINSPMAAIFIILKRTERSGMSQRNLQILIPRILKQMLLFLLMATPLSLLP